jgi:hypothetical protein
MIKPIKTDILFSDYQIGGRADHIIAYLKSYAYKYLKTDSGIYFELNDKNKKTKDKLNYLNNGTYTVVFGIKLIKDKYNNKNWKDEFNEKLILRITTEESEHIISSYKKDKPIFQENLIDIYLYGSIRDKLKHIGYYTITREYITDFRELNITNKIKIIKDYFNVIIKASENGIFFRDSKYKNSGFDMINNEPRFIILDYDDKTLLKLIVWFQNIKDWHFFGTYPPIYICNYFINNNQDINNITKYDKLYVGGMVEFINYIMEFNIKNFLIEAAVNSFQNETNHTISQTPNIISSIENEYKPDVSSIRDGPLDKKLIDINKVKKNKEDEITELFKYFLKDIMIKCININYDVVLTIDEIKQKIICIDGIFLEWLCTL